MCKEWGREWQNLSLYIYISCFKPNLKIFFFSSPQIIDPVFNIYHYRMDGFVYLSQKKEDFSKFRFENQSNIQKRRSTRPNHFMLEIHRNIGPYLFLCLVFSSAGQNVKYFTFWIGKIRLYIHIFTLFYISYPDFVILPQIYNICKYI